MSPRWSDGLTGHALRIAETTNPSVWVAAGPGTGKTFALMRRLIRLLEVDGVDPARVLVCTFTRTAAKDLGRAVAVLGVAGVGEVKALTIHSFCFSMLSQQNILAVTGRVPRTLLQSEERFLLEDMKQAGLGGIRDSKKKLIAFSAAWARLQHEQPGWPEDPTDQQFNLTLISWLKFHRAMLIGELIPEGLKYLRNNAHSPFRITYNHVLVDEYQDLNRAEQQLIELLSHDSLVVIGDEDQSIYSFKHAHPEGIVEFPQTHPHTEQAQLDECRRCPSWVVEMANSLITHNVSRSNRSLRPFPGNPEGEIFSVQWRSMQEEAEGIANFIKARVEAGSVTPGNILILAPRREFGYHVRDALNRHTVSAHSFFSEEILEGDPKDENKCQAQKALALLILLNDSEDCVALRCWCGFGSNSLNSNAWSKLRGYCELNSISPWHALEQLETQSIQIAHTAPIVAKYTALKSELARLRVLNGNDLFVALFPQDLDWAKSFWELKKNLEGDSFSAMELLESVQENITQPELPTDVDYVRVMSPYKSKGLTAEMVIVVGCLEGLMPSIDNQASQSEQARSLEEQRRLFYVAITRTKNTLVLSSVTRLPTKLAFKMQARIRPTRGAMSPTITSSFIAELGYRCPQAITGDEFLRTNIG